MKLRLQDFSTYIFDCDGVILDSNFIKEQNIEEVVSQYLSGSRLREFLNYFNSNSGIPREVKIKKFIKSSKTQNLILNEYMSKNLNSLKKSKLTLGLISFLDMIKIDSENKAYVLSGGSTIELNEVFKYKNLCNRFDCIYGGPKTKEENLKEINITKPSIFFGDSKKDYEISLQSDLKFVFVSDYSSFKNYKVFFAKKKIQIINNFSDINIIN